MTNPANIKKLKISKFLSFIAFIGIFYACNTYRKNSAVNFLLNIQIPLRSGELHSMEFSTLIYYSDDYVIFKTPYFHENNELIINDSARTITEKPISSETKYNYVIYDKKKLFGLKFDSLTVAKPYKIAVDSFLNRTTYPQIPYYVSDNDSLVKTIRKDHQIIEYHVRKMKKDFSNADTIRYTFDDRLKNVPFSFSPFLDQKNNSKLVKVEFINNPAIIYKQNFSSRKSVIEIRKVEYKKDLVNLLIKRYQAEWNNKK